MPSYRAVECRVGRVGRATELDELSSAKLLSCSVLSWLSCQVGRAVEFQAIELSSVELTKLSSTELVEWKEMSRPVFDIIFLKQIHPLWQCFKVMMEAYLPRYNGKTADITKHGLFTVN